MKRVSVFFCLAVLAGMLSVSCAPANTPAGPLTLTGTVTVADASYWANVKIGMIAVPTNNDGSAAASLSTLSSGVQSNRVYLWKNADGSVNNFKPTYFGSLSGSGVSKTYSITIDKWDDSKAFYFVTWFDKNLDSNLNLIDASSGSTTITNSEMNIVCWKQIKATDRAYVKSIFASKSGGQEMYKFNGYSPSSNVNYLYQEIKSDMTGGWDFTLITNIWIQ